MTQAHAPVVTHVLIVEDDLAMQREAVHAASALGADTHCVGTKAEAERLLKRRTFELAIIDLGLPDGSGADLIRAITHSHPNTICVARTVFDDDETLFSALSAGAQGYLLKGQPLDVLRAQLVAAAQGEPVISPAITRKVLAYFRNLSPDHATHAHRESAPPPAQKSATVTPHRERSATTASHGVGPLTPRETDVLAAVGRGLTISEAALALGISENTVKTHVKAAYGKLNISSRASAALEAQRLGLLPSQ
jgi:DNA-binding NarL/FixJ family response regulator